MKNTSAFTLIELLIVIGVLGILAAGLMAAVDPFEQLKKARDANNRNAVIELHNAFTRYYATHGGLPWDDTAAITYGTGACAVALFGGSRVGSSVQLSNAGMQDCILALEGDGELKAGFVNAVGTAQADKLYINSENTTSVSVCFPPEGKGLWRDTSTKYDLTAQDQSAGSCGPQKPVTPDNTCFFCAK